MLYISMMMSHRTGFKHICKRLKDYQDILENFFLGDDYQNYPGLNKWSDWSRCELGKRQKKRLRKPCHSCHIQFEFLLCHADGLDQILSGQDYQIGGDYQIQAAEDDYDYQNAIANANANANERHRGDNSVEHFQMQWFSSFS